MRYDELTPRQLVDCVEARLPAVVPVSQLEPQGDLLPLGADKLILEAVLREACKVTRFVYLPTLHVAACTDFRYWPGLISFKPETTVAVLKELARNLLDQGFERLVFVTYYGGHNFHLLDVVMGGIDLEPDQSITLLRLPTLVVDDLRQLREKGIDPQYPLLAHLRADLVDEAHLAATEQLPSGKEGFLASRRLSIRYSGSVNLAEIMPQGPASGFAGARAKEGARLFSELVTAFADFVARIG